MNIFMFNHAGSLNRGCEAIIKGTVNIMDHFCGRNDYTLSSYAPQEDKLFEKMMKVVPFNAGSLNKAQHIIAALNIKLRSDERYAVIKSYAEFIKDSETADICLSVGGDTYCYGDNAVIRILTEELKKRGKKIVLWGASIGQEDLTIEKEKNLACFDAIFARESLTYELIKNKGLNQKVFLCPDPAFTLNSEILPCPAGWQEGNTLGINLSPLVTKKNPLLFEAVSDFIKYVLINTGMSVALVPHVTSPAGNDMTVLEKLYNDNISESNGRLLLLSGDLSAAQYKGYIASLRFFIGARTHATIAAYTSCIPTIVLGYSVKSRGIAYDLLGNDESVINAQTLKSQAALAKVFEKVQAEEQQFRNRLARVMPAVVKASYDARDKLFTL